MPGYGQFCPVALSTEVLGRRWTLLVVRELMMGSERFNDLRRGLPRITASTLARRLEELRRAGLVTCEDGAYRLTPAGRELEPIIEQLGVWGRRWMPTEYGAQHLDERLLMWDVHRRIDLSDVEERVVIAFHFRDAPPGRRSYWLVLEPGGVDVCLTDPGFDTDLRVLTDVRTLTRVWMGDDALEAALAGGAIVLRGPQELRRRLRGWLKLSSLAGIPAARAAPPS